jgi:hypothetical protein
MGATSTKTHSPDKCGYSTKGKYDLQRRIEKNNLVRKFTRCIYDKRYKCTPENCPPPRFNALKILERKLEEATAKCPKA